MINGVGGVETRDDVTSEFPPATSLDMKSFPSLEMMELNGPLKAVGDWIGNGSFKLDAITKLCVQDPFYLDLEVLRKFFKVISKSCRNIQNITVDWFHYGYADDSFSDRRREKTPFKLDTLSPLLDLPYLKKLDTSYSQPLDAENKELAEFLSNFPRLESFIIGFYPYHPPPYTTPSKRHSLCMPTLTPSLHRGQFLFIFTPVFDYTVQIQESKVP